MTKPRPKYSSDFCQETHDWGDSYRGSLSKMPVLDLDDRLRAVEKRLLIIDPPADTLSMYPALAEAYREYKLIERLVLGNV
ncbi:MAG TPA: hypothetical protein VIY47_03635 [Ignavibacteriaceae bacterium]